jgi:hypothetical protein
MEATKDGTNVGGDHDYYILFTGRGATTTLYRGDDHPSTTLRRTIVGTK